MIFQTTPLAGAYVIEPERKEDHRGFFARIWCKKELIERGLQSELAQSNVGFSHKKGTLRGLHFQVSPHTEVKIVRCPRGAIFDVIVDLRPDSPTHKQWFGIELTADNCKMIYVPEGFAQGYITLENNTEIYYHTTEYFHANSASGIRFNDEAFGITWPIPVEVISDQDRGWPDYSKQLKQLNFEGAR
jgi:dTDP-4-dehydrorhamnose 3,5-epimerase